MFFVKSNNKKSANQINFNCESSGFFYFFIFLQTQDALRRVVSEDFSLLQNKDFIVVFDVFEFVRDGQNDFFRLIFDAILKQIFIIFVQIRSRFVQNHDFHVFVKQQSRKIDDLFFAFRQVLS